jgi:hypothetical protein
MSYSAVGMSYRAVGIVDQNSYVSQRKIQAEEERTCVAVSLGCASLGWRGGIGVAKV